MRLDFLFCFKNGQTLNLTNVPINSNESIESWKHFFRESFKQSLSGSVYFENYVIRVDDLSYAAVFESASQDAET